MRTAIYVGGVVAVLVAGVALSPRASAQSRDPFVTVAPFLPLVGPGSSIGVTVRDVDAGVQVQEVRPDSPAARAGLQKDDVVVEFDGERARSATQFSRLVRETAPGRAVKITIIRGGSRQTLDIAPENRGPGDLRVPNAALNVRPAPPRDFNFDFNWSGPAFGLFSPQRLGVTVSPLTPQLSSYFAVKQGVLITEVTAASPAEAAGLRAGDVITSINGRAVSASDDVASVVREADAGAAIELRVTRERRELTVTAKLPERSRPTAGVGRPI
jgi:serine protease Do